MTSASNQLQDEHDGRQTEEARADDGEDEGPAKRVGKQIVVLVERPGQGVADDGEPEPNQCEYTGPLDEVTSPGGVHDEIEQHGEEGQDKPDQAETLHGLDGLHVGRFPGNFIIPLSVIYPMLPESTVPVVPVPPVRRGEADDEHEKPQGHEEQGQLEVGGGGAEYGCHGDGWRETKAYQRNPKLQGSCEQ